MTKRFILVGALAVVVAAPAAWAHEGHAHTIRGVVTGLDARHVDVKTPGGEILSIAINARTTIRHERRKVAITELQVGRRVVVDIGPGEDPLIARDIQVGVAQPIATR